MRTEITTFGIGFMEDNFKIKRDEASYKAQSMKNCYRLEVLLGNGQNRLFIFLDYILGIKITVKCYRRLKSEVGRR